MTRLQLLTCFFALALVGCPSDDSSDPYTAPEPTAPAVTEPIPAPPPKPFKRDELKTPWALAKVGDWALYAMNFGASEKKFRFEITKVEERTVEYVRKDGDSGQVMGGAEVVDLAQEDERYKDPMTYDGLAQDKDGNEIKPTPQEVEVAGKKLTVLVIKRAMPGRGSTELWMCEQEIRPFMQSAIKTMKDGVVGAELIDFGYGE